MHAASGGGAGAGAQHGTDLCRSQHGIRLELGRDETGNAAWGAIFDYGFTIITEVKINVLDSDLHVAARGCT